jgi:CRP/FNR family transcriptional regulator, cyclic AMP receptor protein
MPVKHFFGGDVLFREGDPADCVLRILSGTAEVIRQMNGSEIVLGRVQSGQHLGEMGVVEGRPHRSASARAVGEVEVEIIGAEDFLEQVARTPSLARELISRLSQRLHVAEDRIVFDEQKEGQRLRPGSLGDHAAIEGMVVTAGTSALRHQFSHRDHINAPFVVGRAPLSHEAPGRLDADLLLQDREPLRLSRDHFAIVRHDGRLFVRDLHSTLGTTVNGVSIGWHFGADEAPLQIGDNEIVAGGVGSPFAFKVEIKDASLASPTAAKMDRR